MQVTTESLKWIVAAMKSNQMAATTPTPDVSIMKKKQEGKYYYVKLLEGGLLLPPMLVLWRKNRKVNIIM